MRTPRLLAFPCRKPTLGNLGPVDIGGTDHWHLGAEGGGRWGEEEGVAANLASGSCITRFRDILLLSLICQSDI